MRCAVYHYYRTIYIYTCYVVHFGIIMYNILYIYTIYMLYIYPPPPSGFRRKRELIKNVIKTITGHGADAATEVLENGKTL